METTLISKEAKQRVFDTVLNSSESLHECFHRLAGIDSWFKVYIKSDDFAKLEPEMKEESFDLFSDLKSFLGNMDEVLAKHRLGIYREN